MDPKTDQPGDAPTVGVPDLLRLCRHLNEAGVQYLVYGGLACLLHGHERMTRDADIYLADTEDNLSRALTALSHWGEGYAAELTIRDLRESVVVRLCDIIVIDLATRVWGLVWAEAWRNHRVVEVDSVEIPILSRQDLIRSKHTYREQDHWDVQVLRSLTGPEPGRPVDF
jgi:hypothetical protein